MRRSFGLSLYGSRSSCRPLWAAQERGTVFYPSPAGSWMIPVIAKEPK